MALSLAFSGVALFLAQIGEGRGRAPREARGGIAPRRAVRKDCGGCERQRALFRYHGVVKWDRYHTLCLRCFRAQAEALKCEMLNDDTEGHGWPGASVPPLCILHLALCTSREPVVNRVCTSS
jgi:hypothetical protein